jgi:arylsulfatase A-like enzyme
MGELGIWGEHATADQITTRIPMIVLWPGCKAGHVDRGLHYSLDLLPTLAQVFKQELAAHWDGASFAAALSGRECGRDELIVSQCAHVCQRSVRWGPWLYMRTYHDGYHLFPEEMLYDVQSDPHEQNDLAAARPDVVREGARRLLCWHDSMMRTMPPGYSVDPLWTVMSEGGPAHARNQLPAYCEYLRKTGREWAIAELKRRHPREFAGR